MTLRKLVENRIKDNVLGFKEVAGAATLKSINNGGLTLPGCYVLRITNSASTPEMLSAMSQTSTELIAVVIITDNFTDEKGAEASDANEILSNLVRESLLGWPPNEDYYELEYVGGQLALFEEGRLGWQDIYRTSKTITSIN